MRAETPSWPISNFFNVLVCIVVFVYLLPLTSVYYIFYKKARAFLNIFIWGVFHNMWKTSLLFPEHQPIALWPEMFYKNRTNRGGVGGVVILFPFVV